MPLRLVLPIILFVAVSPVVNIALAQSTPAGAPAPQASAPPVAAHTLTNADVLGMVKAGFSEKVILLAIRKGPAQFDISPDALVALKNAGVSEAILTAMIAAPQPSAAPVMAPAVATAAVPAQQAASNMPAMTPSLSASPAAPQAGGTGQASMLPSMQQQQPSGLAAQAPTQTASGTSNECMTQGSAASQQVEAMVLSLVNQERQKQGVAALKPNDALSAVARQHSCRMMQTGSLDHMDPQYGNPAQRLQNAGIHVKKMAENLSQNSASEPPSSVIDGWLSDPDHSGNMLDPSFGCTGIGVVTEPDGSYLTTEVFTPAPCPGSGQ